MSDLVNAYRAVHEQGFMPIFVDDGFEPKMLIEACLDAGMKCIEYTQRKPDSDKMIPWIREQYPDLHLLVGSTIDDEKIVRERRRQFPNLLTIAELEAFEPAGYVSMLGWSEQSIKKYCGQRIVIPSSSTANDAFTQTSWGGHFVKLNGFNPDLVKRLRAPAAFDYCPIMAVGGMTPERIPEAVQAGAVLVGAGFDMSLKGEPKDISKKKVAEIMKRHLEATRAARAAKWPAMAKAIGGDLRTWLNSLPHYHPF